MATFYVLPSRHMFGQRFAEILTSLFPDAKYTPWDWPDLAASIAGLIETQGSAEVVYREDLDERLSVKDSLVRDFGAQLADDIIEIEMGAELLQFGHLRWATEERRQAA